MNKKALIILAEGFEEIEAITPIDILRRAGVDITVAGLGGTSIKSARNVTVNTDVSLDDYDSTPDAIIFPGGLGGAENLSRSIKVKGLIESMNSKGKLIAAICASPALVLSPTGVLDGKRATCYPGMEENFPNSVKAVEENVVQDGNIITSRGPATALPFALKIVENLLGKETADSIAEGTLFSG